MKEKIMKMVMNNITKKYPEYDDEKLEIIEYGLDALYITITKTVVIFSLALIFNIFKEVFFILLFYNILRTTAFGMHAKKSSHCYIISITLFIGAALLCKYIDINFYIKLIIIVFSLFTMIIYAPADTYKRPLLNTRRRKIYKIATILNSFIYSLLIILFEDFSVSNYLLLGFLDASLMIHPLTYRMFQLPYNNYKKYETSYS